MNKEWFEGRLLIDDMAMSRCYWKRVIGILLAGLIVLALVWPAELMADPLFRATDGKAVVTLHSDPCGLTNVVVNLPKRATWEEGGKTYEGCYSIAGPFVMFYFDDKKVGLAPSDAFQRVQGA